MCEREGSDKIDFDQKLREFRQLLANNPLESSSKYIPIPESEKEYGLVFMGLEDLNDKKRPGAE